MRVILTGAGGFLGTEVLRQLKDRQDVTVIAVSSKPSLAASEELEGITLVAPDRLLGEPTLMRDADVLLNCAFPRGADGESLASGMKFLDGLFSGAAQADVRAVVNVSSQSVYSQHRVEPADEQTPLCLESKYAVAKYASELMLGAHCSDIPHTNIRMASLIGPGFDERVVNKMARKALLGDDLAVAENGSRFGFLDVRDAANALLTLMGSDSAMWRREYVLGSDDCYTLTCIAEAVIASVSRTTGTSCRMTVRESDAPSVRSPCCSDAFSQDTGWVQQYPLSETVDRIVKSVAEGVREDA
ncbi:hypothetical protein C1878_03820 [Gordonibacter sp. 28C]|uniref:NAD-dependent epimerase/dehydratase family protein n=1 Tax=Gordonibacter sp. 28C TaxID=2078569 RepID=UPI000DF7F173|nr:NAD(P)-dependent oxidoreductase [Gordonibacter sp. 28C]RDB63924.1 hypothetical protein C1878_03820 [Gordonibacter sp. 28C]